MSASHRKSTQAHARPGQAESQVEPGFELASSCDYTWPGLKIFLGNKALDTGKLVPPFICCLSFCRCDLASEMCVTGNVRLPVMKKMKSSRRPKTDHENIDEKIHFIPGRAQAGDDDAVLWLERP